MLILSFIVPIYKVEAVLRRCLDSLYAQDFAEDEFEVVAVDDGSPDHSGEICREYQKRHVNFKYVRQDNQGLSGARNTGLKYAAGKYIAFVDSDDQLVPHSIKKVVEEAERTECEMCFFLSKFYPDTGEVLNRQPFELGKPYTGEYVLLHNMHVSSVWGNIYRADFLRRSGLKFIPELYHEDVPFNYCLYPQAKSMVFTDEMCYMYTQDVESITHTHNPAKLRKALLDQVEAMAAIRDFAKAHAHSWSGSLIDFYHRLVASTIAGTLYSLLRNKEYDVKTIRCFLGACSSEGLYPVRRPTRSRRLDMLVPFLNCHKLYMAVTRIIKMFYL